MAATTPLRRTRRSSASRPTTFLVLLAALLLSLAVAAPTVAAADVAGSMQVNGTSFFWQLVLDSVSAAGQTTTLVGSFTTDFTSALAASGITGATVAASLDAQPVTPASFYVNYTVTPSNASATLDAAAIQAAFMASALPTVNTYVDALKAALVSYEDLLPKTPLHGWTAPTLTLFYEEVAANEANLSTVVEVVASNTSDAIFYFTGIYSGWTLAVQSYEQPMTDTLIATATEVLSRHNYNYTVNVTQMVHQQSTDGKRSRPSLLFYVTVTQGMGKAATDAWNASQIVSMLSSANFSAVLLYYNYNGATALREAPLRAAELAAASSSDDTAFTPTVYVGPNVGGMAWKCSSGCIGMVIMAAVIVFLMLVTLIVVVAIVCCCYGSNSKRNAHYRRASSMDVPAYPDRRSISQTAPLPGDMGNYAAPPVKGRRENGSDDTESSLNNPLMGGDGTSGGILKQQQKPYKKGDIAPAPAIVSPSSTSEGQDFGGRPSREMTTYSERSGEGAPVLGIAPQVTKQVWEGH